MSSLPQHELDLNAIESGLSTSRRPAEEIAEIESRYASLDPEGVLSDIDRQIEVARLAIRHSNERNSLGIGLKGLNLEAVLPDHGLITDEKERLVAIEKVTDVNPEVVKAKSNASERLDLTLGKYEQEIRQNERDAIEEVDADYYSRKDEIEGLRGRVDSFRGVLKEAEKPWPIVSGQTSVDENNNNLERAASNSGSSKKISKARVKRISNARKNILDLHEAKEREGEELDSLDILARHIVFSIGARPLSLNAVATQISSNGKAKVEEKLAYLRKVLVSDEGEELREELQARLDKVVDESGGVTFQVGRREAQRIEKNGRVGAPKIHDMLRVGFANELPKDIRDRTINRPLFKAKDGNEYDITTRWNRSQKEIDKSKKTEIAVATETEENKAERWQDTFSADVDQLIADFEERGLFMGALIKGGSVKANIAKGISGRDIIGTETSRERLFEAGLIDQNEIASLEWTLEQIVLACLINSNRAEIGRDVKHTPKQQEALNIVRKKIERKISELKR